MKKEDVLETVYAARMHYARRKACQLCKLKKNI
jgi:hypothetical protein